MRWRGPQVGDIRVRKKLLLWPRWLNGQWVWLERVVVAHIYEGWSPSWELLGIWTPEEYVKQRLKGHVPNDEA